MNGGSLALGTTEIQPVLCPNQTQNQPGLAPNPIQGGKVMRINRRWLRISLILLVLPLIFALYARAAGDGECKETKYRWDIVHISTFSPVTAFEGGFASALANNGSKITVTGHGTSSCWTLKRLQGRRDLDWHLPPTVQRNGDGTYRVTQLVRFDLAPGVQTGGLIDNIPAAIGDLTDQRGGLLFVKIAYSDGSKGILIVSCRLPGGPDFVTRPPAPCFDLRRNYSVQGLCGLLEPRAAHPGAVDGNRTLFHIFGQDENRDRE